MSEWKRYSVTKPTEIKNYQWRLSHNLYDGIKVTFTSHTRMRVINKHNILTTYFDKLNGYDVIVPNGLEWRETDLKNTDTQRIENVNFESLENLSCPYCSKVPKWEHMFQGSFFPPQWDGMPHNDNFWRLVCCAYGQTPHVKDPRKLTEYRNSIVSRFK